MDREWLAQELERGRSIADIAREVGRHPATVAYWVNKHRLVSSHAAKHAARGGIAESHLRSLVERGLSIREIAAESGVSPTSVRHWLRRFGLKTQPARYAPRGSRHALIRECRVHGWTTFRRAGSGGYRCSRCGHARVARRRRRTKEILVAEAGGACSLCGYHRYIGALHFHHLDPARKRFQLGERGLTRSLATLRQEAENCLLLCANCHAEVEAGLSRVPTSLA
jgi:transposase-like protein